MSKAPPRGAASARVKIRDGNLLVDGWQIALRNWHCICWLYLLNLTFGLLSGMPLSAGLAPYLDQSLAARQIAGKLDAGYLGELGIHLSQDHVLASAGRGAIGLAVIELLAMILLAGGTIRIYLAGEPPRLPVLLARGSEYFWRMVRVSLLSTLISGLILACLLWTRAALLQQANTVYVEGTMFLYAAGSAAFILLVALLLRLWFDLVEVYTIRNGALGNRRIRDAVLPALRLLLRNFWRTSATFLLIGLLGVVALAVCFFLWKDLVPPDQVWLAALVAQLGLLLFLAARYWQRAMQVSLVLSGELPLVASPLVASPPVVSPPVASPPVASPPVAVTDRELERPVVAAMPPPGNFSEPTLRDLVLKLQKEPLANPATIAPPNSALFPEIPPAPRPSEPRPPQDALLQEHEKKVPLPGDTPPADTVPASSDSKEGAVAPAGAPAPDLVPSATEPSVIDTKSDTNSDSSKDPNKK